MATTQTQAIKPRQPYASDLTDVEWDEIAPIVTVSADTGRPRTVDLVEDPGELLEWLTRNSVAISKRVIDAQQEEKQQADRQGRARDHQQGVSRADECGSVGDGQDRTYKRDDPEHRRYVRAARRKPLPPHRYELVQPGERFTVDGRFAFVSRCDVRDVVEHRQ